MFPRLESPTSDILAKPAVILMISQIVRFPPRMIDLISAKATKITTPPAIDITIIRIVDASSILIVVPCLRLE
jgi:hypothetical protein